MKITLILIEKNTSSRKILIDLLKKDNFMVLGEGDDLPSMMTQITSLRPDVVILDIGSRYCNCLNSIRKLIEENSSIKVICLSMICEELFVKQVFQSGIQGYVLTNCAYHELSDAIYKVTEGGIYISAGINLSE